MLGSQYYSHSITTGTNTWCLQLAAVNCMVLASYNKIIILEILSFFKSGKIHGNDFSEY